MVVNPTSGLGRTLLNRTGAHTVNSMATWSPRDVPPGTDVPPDTELWTAPDGGRWLVTVTAWAVVRGRIEPVGVELRSARRTGLAEDEWARGVLPPNSRYDEDQVPEREPLPVTATTWRAPPVARLLSSIRRTADHDRRSAVGKRSSMIRPWRAPRRRRGAVTQEDVVREYLIARDNGEPPSKAVATKLHLSRDAAYQRVRRARAEGLLPPTAPGRASGGSAVEEGPHR